MFTSKLRSSAFRRRGFTLVEILIVVIILGILAAIVIPQFSNASQLSRANSLRGQLQILRSQIQFYKVQHNDILPNLITSQWAQMQGTTNVGGTLDNTATGIFGPYVNKVPVNELNSLSTIAAAPGANVGWVYNAATGQITATNQTPTQIFNETTGVVQ